MDALPAVIAFILIVFVGLGAWWTWNVGHWWPILITTAFPIILILGVWVGWEVRQKKKREREEEERRKKWEREEEERRKKWEREAEALFEEELRKREKRRELLEQSGFFKLNQKGIEALGFEAKNLIKEITQSPIIIDTNIWMDAKLDCFFAQLLYCCELNKASITIPAAVYEEILRLKKDDEKKKCADIAFKRIQHFSDKGVLIVQNLKKIPEKSAYADKCLIDLCEEWSSKKEPFYLLTNDQDLIFRINNLLKEKEFCHIVSVKPTEFATSIEAMGFIPSIN